MRRIVFGRLALVLLVALTVLSGARQAHAAEFVGTAACANCHAEETAAWRGSHHDLAMRHADAESVRGDFDDARLDFAGESNRFFRRDGGYWAHIAGEDGAFRDYRIVFTFGVEPLQQYLVEFPDGRLQAIPFAWDSRPKAQGGQRWFNLYPQFDPTHEFFWTNRGQNWNTMCADCHSTHVRKGYDKAANRFASTWTDVNVGCEACHGPGGAHLAWAKTPAVALSNRGFDRSIATVVTDWQLVPDAATRQPAAPRPSAQLEVCAQCHARRLQLHDAPAGPASGFLDRHLPSLLTAELYHADGQIDEEVFDYGSFLQSKMHARGVVCSNCHEPHSARLKLPGVQLCAQCHAPEVFNTTQHHMHAPGSAGAECVACHMPATTYMQIDARRDHSFKVPNPVSGAAIGVPDACTGCHTGQSPAWAAQALGARGTVLAKRKDAETARAFHAAEVLDPAAEGTLAWIAQDTANAPVVRASALQRLAPYGGPNAQVALARGAGASDPLLRLGVIEGSAALAPAARWQLLAPMLKDSARAVRAETAAALAPLWPQLGEAERAQLRAPLDEYLAVQEFNADRGFGRTNLGNVYRHQGDVARAEAEYRGAIAIEPYFAPAWVNLADLLRAQGRDADGMALLEQGARELPRSGDILHALGLAQVRAGQRAQGEAALGRAVEAAPDNARYRYVYGIALAERDPKAAIVELRKAHALERRPEYLYAACELAVRSGDPSARACIDELRRVAPAEAVQALEAALGGGQR